MANAIVGTLVLLAMAAAIGVPVGVMGGVYLAEYGSSRANYWLRFAADVLNGCRRSSGAWSCTRFWSCRSRPSPPTPGRRARPHDDPAGHAHHGGGARPRAAELPRGRPGARIARWKIITVIVIKTALKGIVTGVLIALARVAGRPRRFSLPRWAIISGTTISASRSPPSRSRSSPTRSLPTTTGTARPGRRARADASHPRLQSRGPIVSRERK